MINVSPGQLFGYNEPGWFRACYAFDEDTVHEACRRLATFKEIEKDRIYEKLSRGMTQESFSF